MKTCTRCMEVKPLESFHRDNRRLNGRSQHCATCCKARVAAWREANRERHREAAREYYYKNGRNKEQIAASNKRDWARAKEKGTRPSDVLTDSYIAQTLDLPIRMIPPELIDLKRAQIMVQRVLKGKR